MSIRSIKGMLCLTLSLCVCALAHGSELSRTRYSKERALFESVMKDLDKGRTDSFDANRHKLANYPLYPYLVYAQLAPRLSTLPRDEVDAFHKQYANSLLDDRLTAAWLHALANQSLWNEYVFVYQSSYADNRPVSSGLQCNYLNALIKTGKKSDADRYVPIVWLTGSSLDSDCDLLFQAWAQDGTLKQSLVWQRIQLALDEKNTALASQLTSMLSSQSQTMGKLMVDVYKTPTLMAQTSRFSADNESMRDVIIVGLGRLLKTNESQAIALWEQYKNSHQFSESQIRNIEQKIALALATDFDANARSWLKRSDPNYENDAVTEWRVRSNLSSGNWQDVLDATEHFSPEDKSDSRWQYWQATALTHTEGKDSARAEQIYKNLTQKNGYYNFLAANVLKQPYHVTDSSNSITHEDVRKAEQNKSIVRAVEFFYMDDLTKSRAEWNYALEHMNDQEHLAAAQIALDLGWYDQSIRTANHADIKDALKYRFPDAYRDPLVNYAKQNSLQSPWVFAVARQESMFIYDVKSPAGALGLLQVMPATAKLTAKKNGIAYANADSLLEPQKNLQIGSAYLRNMLDYFDNDPVSATAAYNAGPGRVKEWLSVRPTTDDIWVETIPFKETRQYVQNVMGFSVLYAHRLKTDNYVQLPPVSANQGK